MDQRAHRRHPRLTPRPAPPPDWSGWRDDPLYYPRSDPLSGGYDPGEDYDGLTAPVPSAPPRSTTPFGQFLPSLFEAVARLPQPAPPGQFLASIGVHLPPPQSVLATRRYDPPPPPLTPLEPPADYTSLTVPKPMVGPQSTERVDGFGATAQRQPGEFEPAEGDGVMMNAAAGLAQGVYGTLGAPVDAMTWALNGGISLANFAGADLPHIEDPFLGSRSLARGGTYLGIPDPESVAAVTLAERIARGVGEGAAYAVAPATMVRGGAAMAGRQLGPRGQAAFGRINSVREAGRDMAIGAAAGTTGKAARELVPEAWKPTAEVVGGLIGGVAGAGALARGGSAITSGRAAADAAARRPAADARPIQGHSTHIPDPSSSPVIGTRTGTALQTYWPPNRGFLETPVTERLDVGTRIDRYGEDTGTFFAPQGTPYWMRSLPPWIATTKPYNVYEVIRPFEVQSGKAAPWFGQFGQGTQYESSFNVVNGLAQGFIKRVGP
ncbi:TNT domain-containing protein [Starkeya sp. ORNL1]|uniref:TNT domain-containing protein n=1 Tax=Starkeya sp. ORNL1 TaxID=2709380 RepID=UPI001463F727|nr:TNT domain-containing protein [Starkeya sp. ORNL1]QJP13729.1 TNT domain-containing protein [Starkeya sp. ORNL1]